MVSPRSAKAASGLSGHPAGHPSSGGQPAAGRPAPALLTATDQAIATTYAQHHTTQLPTSELVRALHDAGIGDRSAHTP